MQWNESGDGAKRPAANREINIQNQLLNFVRKDRSLVTIFLVSGKKFVGQVVGFDRYTIHVRGRDYDQIVFKHAITNVSVPRHVMQKMMARPWMTRLPRRIRASRVARASRKRPTKTRVEQCLTWSF
ncbi:MAG: RNA chaperone Hfq [Acidobacteria bacterium]|nr:RNA chaperone Hfq [Acidobacteriota bacterium]